MERTASGFRTLLLTLTYPRSEITETGSSPVWALGIPQIAKVALGKGGVVLAVGRRGRELTEDGSALCRIEVDSNEGTVGNAQSFRRRKERVETVLIPDRG